jgi:hypothetical protein
MKLFGRANKSICRQLFTLYFKTGGKARRKETTKKTNRWVNNIKMDLREIGWDGLERIGSG